VELLALPSVCPGCQSQMPLRIVPEMRDRAQSLPPESIMVSYVCQHEVRTRVRCREVVLLRAADYARAYPEKSRSPREQRPPRLNTFGSRWLRDF